MLAFKFLNGSLGLHCVTIFTFVIGYCFEEACAYERIHLKSTFHDGGPPPLPLA